FSQPFPDTVVGQNIIDVEADVPTNSSIGVNAQLDPIADLWAWNTGVEGAETVVISIFCPDRVPFRATIIIGQPPQLEIVGAKAHSTGELDHTSCIVLIRIFIVDIDPDVEKHRAS